MAELIEEITALGPFHMTEVMTLSSNGTVNELEILTIPELQKSIGKLYIVNSNQSVSEGTAFLVTPDRINGQRDFKSNEFICLTDFRNTARLFTDPEKFYIVFQDPYPADDIENILNHDKNNCVKYIFEAFPTYSFLHNPTHRS